MSDAGSTVDEELATLRAVFDDVDDAIVALLAQRQRLTDAAGVLKKRAGRAIRDDVREASANARRADKAAESGGDADVVAAVFDVIVRASRARQLR